MADTDVTTKGTLGVNGTSAPNENTGYYLDHVALWRRTCPRYKACTEVSKGSR